MARIDDILSDIARRERQRLEDSQHMSLGLFGGDMGSLVFLYEYSRRDSAYQPIADGLLDRILISLRQNNPTSTYCDGLAGMVLGLYSLCDDGFVNDFTPLLSSIDYALSAALDRMFEINRHDFLHGFVGMGFYWIKRYQTGSHEALEQLARIINHLEVSCEQDDDVIKWPRPEDKMMKRYDISLSHGYSSTIILLCSLLAVPDLKNEYGSIIRKLIRGTLNYIFLNRLDKEKYGCWFASSSLECEQPKRSRLAWCYGDLGIAVAVRNAGVALSSTDLIDVSRQILEYSASYRRNLRQNYVYDMCVCHGAAGIGAIFREMSLAFSSNIMSDAADYWRDIVLHGVHRDDDGYCFRYYDVTTHQYCLGTGILEGSVGVALYLLNECASSSLSKFLLLSS